jgi:hypothetical protein
LNGPVQLTGHSEYLGQGIFSLNYVATVAGTYELTITVDGQTLNQGSFHPTILPVNTVWPTNCVAFVDDTNNNSRDSLNTSIAGLQSYFYVQTKDYLGNNITQPHTELQWNLTFILQQSSPSSSPIPYSFEVVYQGNGIYLIAYNVTLSGIYEMFVTINGSKIEHDAVWINSVVPGT